MALNTFTAASSVSRSRIGEGEPGTRDCTAPEAPKLGPATHLGARRDRTRNLYLRVRGRHRLTLGQGLLEIQTHAANVADHG
jgi:hypothetical protein